ncbi:MAG: hypothetical protein PHT92_05815 [Bacteroidales bacterium]|nr:hypothetical protein [Bacteroidales bacterium]
MTLNQYIKNLSPPFISNENESYFSSLENKFEIFIKYLEISEFKKILSSDDYLNIKTISKSVLNAIDEYLKGKSGTSYRIIENVLGSKNFNLENTTYQLCNENSLIRIRKSKTNLHKRNELFHIPFNQRQKVAKQRYSIEGLPCLYLAATSYTAWLELNKPSFNELWVSAFRATRNIPIFDLSYTLSKLKNDYLNKIISKNETIDKLKLFPIVLATSFRVKYPNDFFHQEYIISGKLLQWIVNNTSFKGIRFLSTKLESYENFEYLWCASNFVIPPENHIKEELYNEFLKNAFRITKPQNWSVLLAYSNAGEVTAYNEGGGNFGEYTKEQSLSLKNLNSNIDDLFFKNYMSTDFFNIDGYLSGLFELDLIE